MSFDVAAAAYDRFMGRWSTQLCAPFLDLLGIAAQRPGLAVLDVGTGPGTLLGEIVARVGADRVAAVDPSPSFVDAAKARHPAVDVRMGRADALPWPDASFDVVVAQLVVHFLGQDPHPSLAELVRVCKHGGAVAASVWDFGGGRGPVSLFWEAARSVDPAVTGEGRLPGARAGHLAELFGDVGLQHLVTAELEATLTFETFGAWWEPFTLGVGPAGAYALSLDPARLGQVREACRARLPDPPFDVRAVAWACVGRR